MRAVRPRALRFTRGLCVPAFCGWGRRKKEAREAHRRSQFAQRVHGLRAKLYNQKRFKEKVAMKKTCVRCPRARSREPRPSRLTVLGGGNAWSARV